MVLYGGCNTDSDAPLIRKVWENLTKTRVDRIEFTYIVGINDFNEIKAIILFCDYTGSSISMHVYAPKNFTRSLIRTIMNYVFNDLKVNRLYVEFPISRSSTMRNANKLGFVYEATIPGYYFYDEDKTIMVLTKDNASKWIN